MGMFHAQAERGLNGSLHPPECCHHRFRAKRLAALPHVAAPPPFSMLVRRISLALHPRYGCLIAEETSDAHPTGCRGERGPCSHRRRTSPASAGWLFRSADPRLRRLSRRRRSGHRGAALRRAAEGSARAIRHRREPRRRERNDRRRSGREVVARRSHAADGGEVAINQHLYKDRMSYDPPRELVAVALIGIVPCVVVVATATPVRTAAELIAYARANRGKLSFSSSGIGNPQQLAGELMNSMAGTDVLHVPYRGNVPAEITK